jgi:Skp family chaperone for outer membrane proteins
MKKILIVCVAFAAGILVSNNTKAQQVKIGSFDEESVLGLFPGIQKVDTLINQYQIDSLGNERDYEISEFKRKDSIFKKDSATMNPSLRQIMQKEIAQHYYKIANWQQYAQQMTQNKQNQLLQPYLEKVYAALQEIIVEQKYTWILKKDAILIPGPLADNLSIKVAQKLKLPLPKDVEEALKAQGLSTGSPTSGSSKPATLKPAVKH